MLAHHYLSALELVGAAGQAEQAEELEANAIRYLALAGERALPLDVERAEASLARALALAPAGHPERASLLERWAQAAQQQGRLQEARAALEEALALYRRAGRERRRRAGADRASCCARETGRPASGGGARRRRSSCSRRSRPAPSSSPPTPSWRARASSAAPTGRRSRPPSGRSRSPPSSACPSRPARSASAARPAPSLGERQGLEDMRRALALAIEQGQGRAAAVLHNNLALASWQYEGPQVALDACREGIDFCERRGIAEFALGIAAMSTTFLAESGRAEQALAEAGPVAERLQAAGDIDYIEPRSVQLRLLCRAGRARAGARRGRAARDGPVRAASRSCSRWRSRPPRGCCSPRGSDSRQARCWSSSRRSRTSAPTPTTPPPCPRSCAPRSPSAQPELAKRLVDGVEPRTPLVEHALHAARAQLAEAAGDHAEAAALYAEAAERWREFGNVPERAYALLGQGRCLAALGQPEAQEPLREARELFASMGYRPALAETEALLGANDRGRLVSTPRAVCGEQWGR